MSTLTHPEDASPAVALPENIAAFRADAANTNESPLYIGNHMLFSDQDLTALKHNLVYTGVVSTVFAGLIGTIANPAIPLWCRAILLATTLTTLHAGCIALWNLTQSHLQLHPRLSPASLWRACCSHPMVLVSGTASLVVVVQTFGPVVWGTFAMSLELILAGLGSPTPVKIGH